MEVERQSLAGIELIVKQRGTLLADIDVIVRGFRAALLIAVKVRLQQSRITVSV